MDGKHKVSEIKGIELSQDQLEGFCRKNHIARLSFFGSVLRKDFGPESDVDVLVEFEEGHVPGFLGIARMQKEISDMIGCEVDLRTPQDLSRYFRDEVVASAALQYAHR